MGPDIGPAAVRRVQSEPNGASIKQAARPAWASADWDPRAALATRASAPPPPPAAAAESPSHPAPSHHHHLRARSFAGSDAACGGAATQPLDVPARAQAQEDGSGSPVPPPARPRLASGVFIPLQGATAVAKGRHNKAVRAAAAAAAAASRALTPGAASSGGGSSSGRRSLDAASPEPDPDVFVIHPGQGVSIHPCPRSPAQRRATFSCGAGPAYAPSLPALAEHRGAMPAGGCSLSNSLNALPDSCGAGGAGGGGAGNPSGGTLFLVPAPSPPPMVLYSPGSSSTGGDFCAPPLSPAGIGPLHASLPLLGALPLPGGAAPRLTPANSLRDCGGGFDSGPLSPQFLSAPAATAAGGAPGKAHAAATAAAQAALQAAATALAAAQQAAATPAAGCGGGSAAAAGASAEVQVAAAAELLQRAQLLQQQVAFEGQQQEQQRLHQQLLQRCQQQHEEETRMLWNGLGLGASGVPGPASAAGLLLSQPSHTSGAPASPGGSGPQLPPLPLSPAELISEPLTPLFSAPAALHHAGGAAAAGCYGQQQRPLSASCSHVLPDAYGASALGGPGVGSFSLWPSAAPTAIDCGAGGSGGRLPQLRFAPQQPRPQPQLQPAVGFEQLAALRELPGLMTSGPWA